MDQLYIQTHLCSSISPVRTRTHALLEKTLVTEVQPLRWARVGEFYLSGLPAGRCSRRDSTLPPVTSASFGRSGDNGSGLVRHGRSQDLQSRTKKGATT